MLGSYLCALQDWIASVLRGYGLTNNLDDKQINEGGIIPSDINETNIAGNSVLWGIIVMSWLIGHWKGHNLIHLHIISNLNVVCQMIQYFLSKVQLNYKKFLSIK